jgi:hypothetical protein
VATPQINLLSVPARQSGKGKSFHGQLNSLLLLLLLMLLLPILNITFS